MKSVRLDNSAKFKKCTEVMTRRMGSVRDDLLMFKHERYYFCVL